MDTTDKEQELISRANAMRSYAERSGVSVEWIEEWFSVVPARLDGVCDYADCEGWHFLPKNFYTAEDVAKGFRPPEILDWMG